MSLEHSAQHFCVTRNSVISSESDTVEGNHCASNTTGFDVSVLYMDRVATIELNAQAKSMS